MWIDLDVLKTFEMGQRAHKCGCLIRVLKISFKMRFKWVKWDYEWN